MRANIDACLQKGRVAFQSVKAYTTIPKGIKGRSTVSRFVIEPTEFYSEEDRKEKKQLKEEKKAIESNGNMRVIKDTPKRISNFTIKRLKRIHLYLMIGYFKKCNISPENRWPACTCMCTISFHAEKVIC